MTPTLMRCSSCSRHFRLREPVCPFCGNAAAAASPAALRVPALPAGASRSRRYAAGAALLGTTVAACGGEASTTSKGSDGGSGGDVMTSSGGASSGGDEGSGGLNASGSGGLGRGGTGAAAGASSGGSTTGGTRGSGGAAGKGGAVGNGGVAGATHNCGSAMTPAGTLCRTDTDCTSFGTGTGRAQCITSLPGPGCGRPITLPHQCMTDADCPMATPVCITGTCGETTCMAACSPDNCSGANECVANKCVPKRCDAAGATPCPAGYGCMPTQAGAGPTGCVLLHCGPDVPCEDGYDCTTTGAGNGCVQRACARDADCTCGYCVNGRCAPTLGYCYEIIATPYGCVWPDEELV